MVGLVETISQLDYIGLVHLSLLICLDEIQKQTTVANETISNRTRKYRNRQMHSCTVASYIKKQRTHQALCILGKQFNKICYVPSICSRIFYPSSLSNSINSTQVSSMAALPPPATICQSGYQEELVREERTKEGFKTRNFTATNRQRRLLLPRFDNQQFIIDHGRLYSKFQVSRSNMRFCSLWIPYSSQASIS